MSTPALLPFEPRKFRVTIVEVFKNGHQSGHALSKQIDHQDCKPLFDALLEAKSYQLKYQIAKNGRESKLSL